MGTYPAIEDHGLIGDLQTAALVASDGTIDWFCAPRFDSPSIFASLLDQEKGGHFRVAPDGVDYVTKQLYLPGTPILITRFLSADGVGEVMDFMPIAGDVATDRHRLIRLVRVVRGQMPFLVEIEPRFDYGRDLPEMEMGEDGIEFRGRTMTMRISASREGERLAGQMQRTEHGAILRGVAKAGDVRGVVIETSPQGPMRMVPPEELVREFEETRDFWRSWIGRSRYEGRWREMVERSAMTLKLMTYAPTGALVAAPTAGLPEQVGGERNWDYRFTWVRDASFSVYALLGLGFTDEAAGLAMWLLRVMEREADNDAPLRLMYRIDGSPDLEEELLEHLEGYEQSAPVRIGNGAADQLQLDIYGEAMDSVYFATRGGAGIGDKGWSYIVKMIDWLCDHWDEPDEGIWETRGGRRSFTYSRLMEWVAFDRAIRLATEYGRPADLERWTKERDEVYRWIMTKGWNDELKAFAQYEGSDVLDASLLLMPLVGFVAPMDPKWLSTLSAMDRVLVSDSLVYRYDPKASPDGLQGSEGTFSLSTFHYVDALARSGRLDDARLTFEKMLTYANHVGLYAEEIGLSGEQLGNFPQAFTHLALINAAINLDYQLDHGAGRVDVV